jgi:UDP-2,4-diacetamido-2,4,6-trideoxy-beta-L-altropyranose hydrolase
MRIIIRVDASVKIGSGHVMRCLTLAEALKNQGVKVEFICREHEGNLISLISGKGFIVHKIPVTYQEKSDSDHSSWQGAAWQEDGKVVQKVLKKVAVDWLVVDHYTLDIRWERQLRPLVKKIMVIDDLADRCHDCDLLLDQNFYLNKEDRYKYLLPDGCIKLLGPQYALLRAEFYLKRKSLSPRISKIDNIFICFGGSDPLDESTKAIKAVQLLNTPHISAIVVLGEQNPNREKVKNYVKEFPNIKCLIQVENISELLLNADLAIGAVGSITWERCALGLPSIVVTTASNQVELTASLDTKKIVHYIGDAKNVVSNDYLKAIQYISKNKEVYELLSTNSLNLVDAKGANRVVKAVRE